MDHITMPGVEWAYGNLMDSRDINNHDIQMGPTDKMSCTEYVKMLSTQMPPYTDDPFMYDYSWQGDQAYKTGIYSDHRAKFVAFHQHYAIFYKESVLYCDWAFGSYFNPDTPDGKGATPQAEPVFYNAVTGKNLAFTDGIETGRKAWNLQRAIFVMQGRHRDLEKFSGFSPVKPVDDPAGNVIGKRGLVPVRGGAVADVHPAEGHQPVPGHPDFIFRRERLAVFVDGCFWHGCPKHGRKPGSNRGYWLPKLRHNRERDTAVKLTLCSTGWTVIRLWEHDLANPDGCAARISRALRRA